MGLKVDPSIPSFRIWDVPVEDPFEIHKQRMPLYNTVIKITLCSGVTKIAIFAETGHRFPWMVTRDIFEEELYRSFPLSKECVLFDRTKVSEDKVVKKI